MIGANSQRLFHEAQTYIPGGVNSPVRAFRGVGGNPLFFKGSEGAYLIDVDENRYIDYVGAWGPLILGHGNKKIVGAITEQLQHGIGYGASTEAEVKLAKKICEVVPSIEKVRLTTSGTEATMSAIRVARGFTGRDEIVKFEGCYHGHSDGLLVKAGSGALTLGKPDSLGVPEDYTKLTHVLPYNCITSAEAFFSQNGDRIACVIIEPIAGNMNLVTPLPGFLEGLRALCDKHGVVLIFDEVMTGFRVALGGAQSVYQVSPDMTCLGKVIGGGLPIGAFGGKQEIMDMIAPLGGVYQAGTLSGSPLAVAAGICMLDSISDPKIHKDLAETTQRLMDGLKERAKSNNIPFTTNHVGGMFGCFFSEEETVSTYNQVMSCNSHSFQKYFHFMLEQGVYLAPSAFEAGFMSIAHQEVEITATLNAAEIAFSKL